MTRDLVDRLVAEGLTPTSWSNGPGDRYAAHGHDYDKVLVVASGSIVFESAPGSRAYRMTAGDRLDLPAGHEHSAVVGDRGVICLEAHLPSGSLARGVVHHVGWAQSSEVEDVGSV